MNALPSGCPINLTLEALGDRWSLIVIRDLMFGNRRTVGGADSLEHSGRPAEAPGESRIGIPSRRSVPRYTLLRILNAATIERKVEPSLKTEWRVCVLDEQEIRLEPQRPTQITDGESEQTLRIGAGEENGEPADNGSKEPSDANKEESDEVGYGEN
jgi:hypothetical protein